MVTLSRCVPMDLVKFSILKSFLVQCPGSPPRKDFPKSYILTFSRSAVLAPGRKGGVADERVNVLPNEPHGLMECPCVIF